MLAARALWEFQQGSLWLQIGEGSLPSPLYLADGTSGEGFLHPVKAEASRRKVRKMAAVGPHEPLHSCVLPVRLCGHIHEDLSRQTLPQFPQAWPCRAVPPTRPLSLTSCLAADFRRYHLQRQRQRRRDPVLLPAPRLLLNADLSPTSSHLQCPAILFQSKMSGSSIILHSDPILVKSQS